MEALPSRHRVARERRTAWLPTERGIVTVYDRPVRILRRFESDHRFFELVLEDHTISRRTGIIGTDGNANDDKPELLTHASKSRAMAAFAELIELYTSRGYRMVERRHGDDVPDTFATAGSQLVSNPELETQCLAAASDAPAPWSVYADWLMANGDPRGQLAALHVNGKLDDAKRLYVVHREQLVGEPLQKSLRGVTWRHGFPVGLRIRTTAEEELAGAVRQILALPFARFVESLRFGLDEESSGDNDWEPTLAAVIDSVQAPRIRELRFDDYTSDDTEISWAPFGDLSRVIELPALEVLTIRSGMGGTLGTLALPELRTFIRVSGGLAADEITAIGKATWPKLEHLEVWTGSENYGAEATVELLAPILAASGLPALRHLAIANSELSTPLIPALARSPVLRQLRTLDLSKGVMMAAAAAALIEHADAFRHLAAIDLGENQLLPQEVDRIVAVLPQVTAADQRGEDRTSPDDEDYDPDDDNRYVALGE